MPEHVSRLETGLPPFPAGQGKGAVFSPLKQDIKDGELRAHAVQTILADQQGLYLLWRDVSLASRWQEYVISVTPTSEKVSHWIFGDPSDPDGKRIEYDSEIVEDIPGERIAWRSITEGVDESGIVTFEPHPFGRGTLVTLQEYVAVPGGKLGNIVAGLSKRTPKQIVIEDLRHFKQLAESGEIPTVAKNPHGPRGLSGSFKTRMHGENNPTPPGSSNLDGEDLKAS
jgi:uncharacterized membrane protein